MEDRAIVFDSNDFKVGFTSFFSHTKSISRLIDQVLDLETILSCKDENKNAHISVSISLSPEESNRYLRYFFI